MSILYIISFFIFLSWVLAKGFYEGKRSTENIEKAQKRRILNDREFLQYFSEMGISEGTILDLRNELLKYLPVNFPLYPEDKLNAVLDIDDEDIYTIVKKLVGVDYLEIEEEINWDSFADIARLIERFKKTS